MKTLGSRLSSQGQEIRTSALWTTVVSKGLCARQRRSGCCVPGSLPGRPPNGFPSSEVRVMVKYNEHEATIQKLWRLSQSNGKKTLHNIFIGIVGFDPTTSKTKTTTNVQTKKSWRLELSLCRPIISFDYKGLRSVDQVFSRMSQPPRQQGFGPA